MQTAEQHAPRFRRIAFVEMIIGAGIILFWISFFIFQPMRFSDPLQGEIYHAFEYSFVVPDSVLAILLLLSGGLLLRARLEGLLLSLVAAGMLVFLGLLDISFNLQQGIYAMGSSEACFNGLINLICVAGGGLLVKFIVQNMRKDESTNAKLRSMALEERKQQRHACTCAPTLLYGRKLPVSPRRRGRGAGWCRSFPFSHCTRSYTCLLLYNFFCSSSEAPFIRNPIKNQCLGRGGSRWHQNWKSVSTSAEPRKSRSFLCARGHQEEKSWNQPDSRLLIRQSSLHYSKKRYALRGYEFFNTKRGHWQEPTQVRP